MENRLLKPGPAFWRMRLAGDTDLIDSTQVAMPPRITMSPGPLGGAATPG